MLNALTTARYKRYFVLSTIAYNYEESYLPPPKKRRNEKKRREEKKKKAVSIQFKGTHQSILEKFNTRSNLNVVVMEVSKL